MNPNIALTAISYILDGNEPDRLKLDAIRLVLNELNNSSTSS